jgi:hypothetical protein
VNLHPRYSTALLAANVLLLMSCSAQSPDGNSIAEADLPDSKSSSSDTATGLDSKDTVECIPDCEGKTCGDDGCGGSCGSLPPGVICTGDPWGADCTGKECGPDGMGGYCGNRNAATNGCPEGEECDNGECHVPCVPDCTAWQCGDDGCGGSCGTCPCEDCSSNQTVCEDGLCGALSCGSSSICMCVFECFEMCPQGDSSCHEACVNGLPPEAQQIYDDFMICASQPCYFFGECPDMLEECPEEFWACVGGSIACVDMYLALQSCPPIDEDQDCASNSISQGTEEAQKTWMAFVDCLEESGYFECPEGDDDCMESNSAECNEQLSECLHGDLSCNAIQECLDTPAPEDPYHYDSCVLHGTLEAQGSYQDLIDCVAMTCGETPSDECGQAATEGPCAALHEICQDA